MVFHPFKVGQTLSSEAGVAFLELDSVFSRLTNPLHECDCMEESLPPGLGARASHQTASIVYMHTGNK